MIGSFLGLILFAAPEVGPATASPPSPDTAPPVIWKVPGMGSPQPTESSPPSAPLPAPDVGLLELDEPDELDEPAEPDAAQVEQTYHWEKASPVWPRPGSRPIRWRIDPFLELGTLTVVDRGYRALDDGRNLLQLGVGLRVDARVRGPLFLGAGVAYAHASGSAGPYQGALTTGLRANGTMASLRASVVLIEGLDVVFALEGGPQFVRTVVNSSNHETSAAHLLGSFAAKAGLSLYVPKVWHPRRGAARFTGGINLAMGYGVGTRLRLQPHPDVADDAIRTQGTKLGDVRMHGYVWSLGLFLRFM